MRDIKRIQPIYNSKYNMKPILFNTPMVQAILEGRKTQTRRVCKVSSRTMNIENKDCGSVVYPSSNFCGICADFYDKKGFWRGAAKPKYQPGDILYVRETWKNATGDTAGGGYGVFDTYIYKADGKAKDNYPIEQLMVEGRWHPSIQMPKEAARLFLRVTDVRVERLQDITTDGAKREGAETAEWDELQEEVSAVGLHACTLGEFFGRHIWDRTLQGEENHNKYCWDANPFVWVYTFERIGYEEAM